MLKNDEIKILKFLFDDLGQNPTIRNISISLKQKYSQTFKTVKSLEKNEYIKLKTIGKGKVISLNFLKDNLCYVYIEIERTLDILERNKEVVLIQEKLKECGNFVSLVFGSYAKNKNKINSDVDLLVIVPDSVDIGLIKSNIKNKLSLYNVDLNIINESSLFQMWQNSYELNVGNEILKNHYILTGFEIYINYLRKKYGR